MSGRPKLHRCTSTLPRPTCQDGVRHRSWILFTGGATSTESRRRGERCSPIVVWTSNGLNRTALYDKATTRIDGEAVYTVEPDSPYAVRSRLARGPTAGGQVDSLGKEYAWSARPRYVQVRRVHRASRAGESGLGRPPTDRCLRVRGVCMADGVGLPTCLCVWAESTTHARQGRISDGS